MAESKLKGVIDVCALIIAAAALAYTIYQHKLSVVKEREQTERSIALENEKSRPYVQLEFLKADYEEMKGIIVYNIGHGPAKIESFKYSINEQDFQKKIFSSSWVDKNRILTFTKDSLQFEKLNTLPKDYVITVGKENKIFLLGDTSQNFYETLVRKDMENLIIEIEYSSLSSLDSTNYFVRYCENFISNNIRDKNEPNIYE
ncbi:hypothetical protein FGM00_07445 [Aggregatimonas sangjinii]|uniref:Uncharacterized protein n=1 Tax=Aggregatimonas sangjinii TaxID=2583587 RepID=A0A5B7SSI7_9FLAO|nr:hypothetical protein [Aggregatimonas sangjinii]QCW99940.1 hypothetical protein FGM00_07445 [Aggregatimonas sangjinii]